MKTNEDFNVPYYIVEELVSYIETQAQGKCRSSQYDNLVALIGLAKVNNRLTPEQARFLIEEFNREKT